jgi:hypothetical protein
MVPVTAFDLPMWRIEHDSDAAAGGFVARLWTGCFSKPTDRMLHAATLDQLRGDVQHATDFVLVRLDRRPEDDAALVERWL